MDRQILTLLRFDQNVKLQEEIENQEGASHEAVKKLLRKYEKFRVVSLCYGLRFNITLNNPKAVNKKHFNL